MSSKDLKSWMDRTGMTAVDIASILKIDPATVKRYLKTNKAHRSTIAAYERLIVQYESTKMPKAAG